MSNRLWQWIALAAFIGSCLAVGAIGSIFTAGSLRTWYAALEKPAWTPPGWVFGPVWTVLYIAMGCAAWLVWRERGFGGAAVPLTLFGVQLALNLAWTWVFFGLHAPGAAFLEIMVLWLAILATIASFQRVRPLAAALLVPYLLWVSYAATLNFGIWRMNAA